jgi:hypothetical protein
VEVVWALRKSVRCNLQGDKMLLYIIYTTSTVLPVLLLLLLLLIIIIIRCKAPRNSMLLAHVGGKFSALFTGGLSLPPRIYSWYSFIFEAEPTQGRSAAGRIEAM